MIARFLPALAFVAVLLGGMPDARAANAIQVIKASLEPDKGSSGYSLSADFYLPISTRIQQVLDVGVPLHFVVEFTLSKPRWYWSDQLVSSSRQEYRLSYHPITRRYRLRRSGYSQDFVNLDQAVRSLSRIRGWAVLRDARLQRNQEYIAQLRMRLDSSRLPGPLQIDALNNQDWNIEAPWMRLRVMPGKSTSDQ